MNSMSEQTSSLRDLDRIEDRARQQREVDELPILLVEGPSDLLVLKAHLPNVHIFPTDGKTSALRAIRQLLQWGMANVIAVIDRDFDNPSDTADIGDALHPYEMRDLEGMLIEMGVLTSVIQYQGNREKIELFGGAESLVAKLVETARPLTALRSHNRKYNLALSFDELNIAHKTDLQTLEFEVLAFCSALMSVSDTEVKLAQLLSFAKTEVTDELGPRGKDVVSLAGVALRSVAGSLPLAATKEEVLNPQVLSSAGFALSASDWLRVLQAKLNPSPSL